MLFQVRREQDTNAPTGVPPRRGGAAVLLFSPNISASHQICSTISHLRDGLAPIAVTACNIAPAEVSLRDVGLREPDESEASASGGFIRYRSVFEDRGMCIGVFELPKNSIIPLHNHPGMTVFSRVLYGQLRIRAYDWASSEYYSEVRP